MKKFTFHILVVAASSLAQITCHAQTVIDQYREVENLLRNKEYPEAHKILQSLEHTCNKQDTLYAHILWTYTGTATFMEKQERMEEHWKESLGYALEAIDIIVKGEKYFDDKYKARLYWMYKNAVVGCFGLGKFEEAKKYRTLLYKAYTEKKLPEGINEFFNFESFKWENKNVWGYEYYKQLGDPGTEGSFSKIIYYVFSTNSDGSDKDELYRLHVLKFHKSGNDVPFDYVLTKRLVKATDEVSGTFLKYTYKKDIDYPKLRNDIRLVLGGNYESK